LTQQRLVRRAEGPGGQSGQEREGGEKEERRRREGGEKEERRRREGGEKEERRIAARAAVLRSSPYSCRFRI
jgi:hypothetical protein